MSLSADDIKKVAHLARLEIQEENIPAHIDSLNNILNLVEEMNTIDTQGVTPLAHPLDLTQVLREDKVTEKDQRELFQSIAPKTEAGYYLVPQVIEEG